ncbi:MAG: hypothetical protein WC523_04310 [Patescibacteria group bacterium]
MDFVPDISDTLFVWNSLDQAKRGINPYGKDIAEVYVKHLIPHKFDVENESDAWKYASRTLYSILKNFCEMNCVHANVNGQEIGDWMDDFELRHKCDVRIYKELPKKKTKKRRK